MNRYARQTHIDVARSRVEVERVVMRYGCGQFVSGQLADGRAIVGFSASGRQVRITLRPPDPTQLSTTEKGRKRSPGAAQDAHQQEIRRRWRALVLVLKAKFEAVESGISTFEDEFLAYTSLPDGTTVGEAIGPAVQEAYLTGRVKGLLPAFGGKR